MDKIPKEQRFKNIVCKGLEHLQEQLQYGQSTVINKFKTLDHPISPASLSNIKKGKKVGLATLSQAAKGMEVLLSQELDLVFDPEIQDFRLQHTPGWQSVVVPERPESAAVQPVFILHADGRLPLQQKTAFIRSARQEVLEIGVRLHSFSSYFTSQNDGVYRAHVVALLQKGVQVKGYLLHPECNEARLYFDDRAKVQGFEKDAIAEIKKVMQQLRTISAEFEALQLPGKFEIYLYKHLPYGFFFAVDGATEAGKMLVSPYLYGVRRANCPVFEFSKKDQPLLFRKYWESMQLFLDGAQKLI